MAVNRKLLDLPHLVYYDGKIKAWADYQHMLSLMTGVNPNILDLSTITPNGMEVEGDETGTAVGAVREDCKVYEFGLTCHTMAGMEAQPGYYTFSIFVRDDPEEVNFGFSNGSAGLRLPTAGPFIDEHGNQWNRVAACISLTQATDKIDLQVQHTSWVTMPKLERGDTPTAWCFPECRTGDDPAKPPRAIIDIWNEGCGEYGGFNEETNLGELNGLTDITYPQMLTIIRESASIRALNGNGALNAKGRTLFPITTLGGHQADSALSNNQMFTFARAANMESIRFTSPVYSNFGEMFQYCGSLRWVYGQLNIGNCKPFPNSPNLEYFEGKIGEGLDLTPNGNLNLATFTYIWENASNSGPITIFIHPDVYNKFHNDPVWITLRGKFTEKNISLVTAH